MSEPSNGEYQSIVQYCVSLYEDFSRSKYRKKKLKEIRNSREIYEQKEKKKTFPWPNAWSLVLPFGTITVDNLEPRFVSGLVGRDPIVSFTEGDDDKDPETVIVEDWYNRELKTTVNVEERARSITHNLLIDGTVFIMPGYDVVEETTKEFIFDEDILKKQMMDAGVEIPEDMSKLINGKRFIDPSTGEYATVEVKEETFNGGTMVIIPPDKVLFPDDIGTIKEWRECPKIIETSYTYAELMRLKDTGNGYIEDNITKGLLGAVSDEEKTEAQEINNVDITGKEVIPVIQCHVSFCPSRIAENEIPEEDTTDFTEENYLIEIVKSHDLVIRFMKQSDILMTNRPLIHRMRLFPEEGQSMGTSTIEKIKHIQEGGSDVFNRMMDVIDLSLIPFYFYEDGAGVKEKQVIHPGKGIKVGDISKVKEHEVKVSTAQAMEALNFMIALWERMVNLSNPQLGRTSSKGEGSQTATEILSVIQEGNIKHNYQSKTTKDEFIEVLKTVYDFYYQYMPEGTTVEQDDKPVPLPRHAMRRQKKFILMGSTEQSNKLIERKETEDFTNAVATNPMFNAMANPQKVWEDFLASHGRQNVGEYTNPEMAKLFKIIEAEPGVMQWIMDNLKQQMQQPEEPEQKGAA